VDSNVAGWSSVARRAVQSRDWGTVAACAEQILRVDELDPEGLFLRGLAQKARGEVAFAAESFAAALRADPQRYDAAVELASQYVLMQRQSEALGLLKAYEARLANSPRYLDLAAEVYSRLGLHERAWPLYSRATEVQPGVDRFEAHLAACAVYLGKVDEAQTIYGRLLEKHPNHQRNHYELARLATARDRTHVEQMLDVLRVTNLPHEKNIFLYYALGKELEDLGEWDEAFRYYSLAGDTAARVGRYDVANDLALVDEIVAVSSPEWLAETASTPEGAKTPIFIVGLPRTGTTLTERIVSSHSQVQTLGETFFVKLAICRESGVEGASETTPAVIEAAAARSPDPLARAYTDAVTYRLGTEPFFVDKYPENFLYLGFIARSFPQARLLHLKRHPMDACFALYKQSYFRYAYRLGDLGRFYVAYDRLLRHWRALLGSRLIEVEYEALVSRPEAETRALLERLGLPFEAACLEFEKNAAPSQTASAVQVREPAHTRSVGRWRNFEKHLAPLASYLRDAGIDVD
jgi:tetratricopeptide (TPR) repeat protein